MTTLNVTRPADSRLMNLVDSDVILWFKKSKDIRDLPKQNFRRIAKKI